MPKAQALTTPGIPTKLLATAAGFTGIMLLLAYLVAFDQGTLSQSGMYLHELMHDGRHLLGVPCH
ncbi:CbtB domain-containing protein [Actinoplanes sp. NPDC049802]|uniref:CbtB domain-containing protein n=1 Tax=Actinoplanes sp. NPDC049802 TaxID=3154742 RepID=UPI0033E5CC54